MIAASLARPIRRWFTASFLVGGLLSAGLTWSLLTPSVTAQTPPVEPMNALVTWFEDGPEFRIMGQRVDGEGLRGEPYEIFMLPVSPMNTRVQVGQLHGSPDGRVLSFFYSQLDTIDLSRENRLVVVTLGRNGRATGVEARRLPDEFNFWKSGDQILVASQPATE